MSELIRRLMAKDPLMRPDPAVVKAVQEQVARGKYLATIGLCGDCHTPGGLIGRHDDCQGRLR